MLERQLFCRPCKGERRVKKKGGTEEEDRHNPRLVLMELGQSICQKGEGGHLKKKEKGVKKSDAQAFSWQPL